MEANFSGVYFPLFIPWELLLVIPGAGNQLSAGRLTCCRYASEFMTVAYVGNTLEQKMSCSMSVRAEMQSANMDTLKPIS